MIARGRAPARHARGEAVAAGRPEPLRDRRAVPADAGDLRLPRRNAAGQGRRGPAHRRAATAARSASRSTASCSRAKRHDIGNPVDWLKTNLLFAARRPADVGGAAAARRVAARRRSAGGRENPRVNNPGGNIFLTLHVLTHSKVVLSWTYQIRMLQGPKAVAPLRSFLFFPSKFKTPRPRRKAGRVERGVAAREVFSHPPAPGKDHRRQVRRAIAVSGAHVQLDGAIDWAGAFRGRTARLADAA